MDIINNIFTNSIVNKAILIIAVSGLLYFFVHEFLFVRKTKVDYINALLDSENENDFKFYTELIIELRQYEWLLYVRLLIILILLFLFYLMRLL